MGAGVSLLQPDVFRVQHSSLTALPPAWGLGSSESEIFTLAVLGATGHTPGGH